jgi:hypothetical protein
MVNTSGEPDWKEVNFFHAEAAEGLLVTLERREKGYDFVLLPDVKETVLHVSQMLSLPELPTQPDALAVTLDLFAFAALVAGADAVQATALRARLARVHSAKPILTPELLESELEKALSHPETNWAAAAAHHVSPVKLASACGRMTVGIAALQSAGLVRPVQRGFVFTETGEQTANGFNNLVKTAALTLSVLHKGEWVKAAHASLFVCANDIWIATWSDVSSANASIQLIRASAAGAREHIRDLLEAQYSPPVAARAPVSQKVDAALEPRCAACQRPITPEARFCSSCGADLSIQKRASCPACGKVITKPGAKFCTGCGAQLSRPTEISERSQSARTYGVEPLQSVARPQAIPAERRCPNPQCGKVVAADKKFCTSCGTRMPGER